ncbi:MAG: DUF2304 domain-containing protein [Coriobacteriia bacterium]|nr:DUF2304 domain-containing protein [Coriobacteriia bacterium]
MNVVLRLGAALFFGVFLVYVLKLVSKGKLLLKYALLWMFLCAAALICDVWPGIIYAISGAVGFISPSNFVLLGAVVVLLAISLSLSVAVSRHVLAVKNLTQRVAILEKELESKAGDSDPLR